MVCKSVFHSKFPDIPDNAGKVTRRRRRTQAIVKCYVFCANAKISGEVWHIHEKEISLYYHLKKKQETQLKPKQVKQDILYS